MHQIVLEQFSDFAIGISFPGYKARVAQDGNLVFDYRIDLVTPTHITSLSHVNILVDLYCKAASSAQFSVELLRTITSFALHPILPPEAIFTKITATALPHDRKILDDCVQTHQSLGKVFNLKGNEKSLSIPELFHSMKWIVLQEDINYPISKGFLGRRMCFARYAEGIYAAGKSPDQLQKVVRRALSHSRPQYWSDVNYSFLQKII